MKKSTQPAPYRKIYAVVRRIPRGKVATYGQVAALAGLPGRARQVGTALGCLADGSDVPWQRVVNARGEVSPRGDLGVAEGYQRHLLTEEGVELDARGRIDLERFLWDPLASPTSSPKRKARRSSAVREIRDLLAARGRPERAEGERRYLKSDLDFLGVSVPDLRAVFRAWQKAHPDLDRDSLVRLVRELWETPVHELRAFGIELLRFRLPLLTSADLDLVESLLRRSGSWAYVDTLAIHVAGPLVERDPRLLARLDRWIADPDFWVQRAALLALLPPLRRGEMGEWVRFVRYADALLAEKEFFLRKAIGWVLREVAKKDPARVRRFLAERQGKVSGVTRREAERYL